MPPGVIYVGRGTHWGNPFPVSKDPSGMFPRADSVRMHRELTLDGETWFTEPDGTRHHFIRNPNHGPLHVPDIPTIRRHLAGHDLACWCAPDQECHADLYIELANPKDAP